MGQEEVPGHVEARGDGRAEQEGGGLEQGGVEAASINLRKNLDGTGWRARWTDLWPSRPRPPGAASLRTRHRVWQHLHSGHRPFPESVLWYSGFMNRDSFALFDGWPSADLHQHIRRDRNHKSH